MENMETFHVAIIMDGNGRWAQQRNLGRPAGHRAGAEAVRRAVEAAPTLGVTDLTLYAFSSDNWRRPPVEVAGLMRQFCRYLLDERERCAANGIRVSVIGRRDRLPRKVLEAIALAEQATRGESRLRLRIAVDYSSREVIFRAAQQQNPPRTRERFAGSIAAAANSDLIPPVDLLIRTGREKRLSDFLLWEIAYAELCFLDVMWPDFDGDHFCAAVAEFEHRLRRFGAIPPSSMKSDHASAER